MVYPRYSDAALIGGSTNDLFVHCLHCFLPPTTFRMIMNLLNSHLPCFLPWFSDRYFDVSLLLVTLPNQYPCSISSETIISHFVHTRTKVQFSRWNIVYNVHGYHKL